MQTHLLPEAETEILERPQLQSRRSFVKSGALIMGGLAFGLQWLSSCTKEDSGIAPMWKELSDSMEGPLLMPDSLNFSDKASPWALEHKGTLPQAIAQCVSSADVKSCMLWAQKYRIPLVARSGGHSYAGYSLTTGLMIDMSLMKAVTYDPNTKRVKTGGGARNKQVFEACEPLNVAITHGRCYEVGVSGLTLGGGIGFDMRANGYTCDKLVETEIVVPDGRILTCNANQNSDLFWACRGAGGGNYGIHTSFTFETFPVGTIATFLIKWKQQLPEIFAAVQTFIQTAPNQLGMKLSVDTIPGLNGAELSITLLGQLAGPEAQLRNMLAPLFAIATPATSQIETQPYWKGQEFLSEEGSPEYSHERSRFIKGYLDQAATQKVFDQIKAWPGTSKAATWKFFLLGGEIDKKTPDEMALIHRGYTMLSSIELEWTEKDDAATIARNKNWMNTFHQEMEPFTSSHCYQNFIDPSQEGYLDAYYGANLPRLQEVKRKYDPQNIMKYPQSIPV